MVGASPNESSGIGAKIYFTHFAEPDFTPGIMTKSIKLCSIGSGSGVSEYKHYIKPLLRTSSGIMRGEVMHPGGWGEAIGSAISHAIKDHPRHGISRHIHMVLVRRGSIVVGQNDENIYPSGDAPMIQFRMPEVAKTYEGFLELAAKSGHDSACAAC